MGVQPWSDIITNYEFLIKLVGTMGTSKVRCDEQLVILVVLNASNLWHDIHFLHVLPTFDNVGVQTVELGSPNLYFI